MTRAMVILLTLAAANAAAQPAPVRLAIEHVVVLPMTRDTALDLLGSRRLSKNLAAGLTVSESQQRERRSRQQSALIGAGLGAAAGVLLGLALASYETDCHFCGLGYSVKYGIRGAAVGAVIGLIVSARSDTTRNK